jgi:molybdopterin synthase sulfur carrier subunit
MKLNILYFAWVRERVGHSRETVETDAATVADLVVELGELTTHLKDSCEVAFFPPMTGG